MLYSTGTSTLFLQFLNQFFYPSLFTFCIAGRMKKLQLNIVEDKFNTDITTTIITPSNIYGLLSAFTCSDRELHYLSAAKSTLAPKNVQSWHVFYFIWCIFRCERFFLSILPMTLNMSRIFISLASSVEV